MQSVNEILKSAPEFIESVCKEAKQSGISLEAFEIDHFCFRVETVAEYEAYKKEFHSAGTLLSEAQIGGRPISTFKLNDPISVMGKKIPCVEIPAPKEGAPYTTGLEHVECVVPEALTVFIQRYPTLKFDLRAMKKALNPEVALKLPSGKSVKFHNQSLETVIEIEKKLGL